MFSLKPAPLSYGCKNGKNKTFSCRASPTSSPAGTRNKKTNLYKVLSLDSEDVGFDEIKKAYRSMALRYHPDVCAKEGSTDMFVEVRRAYETLSDPRSRRAHDVALLTGAAKERVSVRSTRFSRDAWEAQLNELARRSDLRREARNSQ